MTVAALRDELATIRGQGWGAARDELEEGLTAVAAPVRDHTGDVVAALSISGPSFRMDADRIPELSRLAIDAADAVSVRLGHTA